MAAQAGRVEDCGIGHPLKLGQHPLRLTLQKLNIIQTGDIYCGILYRSGCLLDGNHPTDQRRQQGGEGAHPGVDIDHQLRAF
ncbi:hypothetical protein ES707_20003 [subsurface metagenome]